MKIFNRIVVIVLCFCLSTSSLSFAGETIKIDLEKTIELAKQNSANLRTVKSKEYDVTRQKQEWISGANHLDSALDNVYEFKNMQEAIKDSKVKSKQLKAISQGEKRLPAAEMALQTKKAYLNALSVKVNNGTATAVEKGQYNQLKVALPIKERELAEKKAMINAVKNDLASQGETLASAQQKLQMPLKLYSYLGRSDKGLKSSQSGYNIKYAQAMQASKTYMDAYERTNNSAFLTASQTALMKANQAGAVAGYISAYMAIGDSELTRQDKYEIFKKREAAARNAVAVADVKYSGMLKFVERATEEGIIRLYIGVNDLEKAVELKNQFLEVNQNGLHDLQELYEVGFVSKHDVDIQKNKVELAKLDAQNYKYQYENYSNKLKRTCHIPYDNELVLESPFDNLGDIELEAKDYFDKACENNMDYANLVANLDMNEKNLEVLNHYIDDYDHETGRKVFYKDRRDLEDEISDLKDKIKYKRSLIECDVEEAYNHVKLNKESLENKKMDYELSKAQLKAAKKSFEIGMKTPLELNKVKLKCDKSEIDKNMGLRAYNSSLERFKLLVDYGISYNM